MSIVLTYIGVKSVVGGATVVDDSTSLRQDSHTSGRMSVVGSKGHKIGALLI